MINVTKGDFIVERNDTTFIQAFKDLHQDGKLWDTSAVEDRSQEDLDRAVEEAYELLAPYREITFADAALDLLKQTLIMSVKALLQVNVAMRSGADLETAELLVAVTMNDTVAEVNKYIGA